MLPQRAPTPSESIDHGVHRDEPLRQRLPQDCRGVRPRTAATAARSPGSRSQSEAPPVCNCRLCTWQSSVGLKGNSHVNRSKVCNVYGKFCGHIGSSIAVSVVASILLVSTTPSPVVADHLMNTTHSTHCRRVRTAANMRCA
ncbi:hypothetical protein BHM03_00049932 [Ensete ventricosum]|nr:hypothetical protein BHM03_00049932 [Ensete ventricosum]